MNHLITGSELALKAWPKYRHSAESEQQRHQNEWYENAKIVYLHYVNGWNIFDRPIRE